MAATPRPLPPITRPDGKPPHENPIRALREELRLSRQEFAQLLTERAGKKVSVGAVRTWEDGVVFPRNTHLDAIFEVAERNRFPLSHRAMHKALLKGAADRSA